MKRMRFIAIPFVAVCLMLGGLFFLNRTGQAALTSSPSMQQGTIVVTTLEDELNDDGDCSLREAVAAANDNSTRDACSAGDAVNSDTITFDVTGVINLASQLMVMGGGPLVVDGRDVITISGGGSTRIWFAENGSELTLSHMAIIDGQSDEGGGLYNDMGMVEIDNVTFSENQGAEGGAIYNYGTMRITDTQFIQNDAPAVGGAILNDGIMSISNSDFNGNTSYFSSGAIDTWQELTVTDSTFVNNSTSGDCGGISGGKLTITHSIFSGNVANWGGGVCIYRGTIIDSTFIGNSAVTGGGIAGGYQGEGEIYIINSTFTGNSASLSGGGIYDEGITTIINSTISGNSSDDHGGGISVSAAGFIPSKLFVNYSTISDNNAPTGGGIYNNGVTSLSSSIVGNNLSGGDCLVNLGTITDAGHNLDSDGSCGLSSANASLPHSDPHLGPLQDNGGSTFTQALQTGSPAIDAGDNADCPQYDQRGVFRPIDGDGNGVANCDMGSFEAGGSLLTVTTVEDEVDNDGYCSLREALTAANTNLAVDLCGTGSPLFDTIDFDVIGVIALTDPVTVTNGGKLLIKGNDYVALDGGGTNRVMWVNPGAILNLWNITIEHGNSAGYGAGLYNNGNLAIANSTFSNNTGLHGGGIYNAGSLTINKSTFFENSAVSGGAISNWGPLTIINSTFSGNNANDWAGGIDNWGTMTLLNTTISQNTAIQGGAGIYASNLGSTSIKNTIVADNLGGDCSGQVMDSGHNLDSDGSCSLDLANGSLPNTSPLLVPLADNGGPTFTQALLPASPAIDAGNNNGCPSEDQRGNIRPLDGNGDRVAECDIGAYEAYTGYLVVDTLADEMKNDGKCSLREALQAANANSLVDTCGQGEITVDTIIFAVEGTITINAQLSVAGGGPVWVNGGNELSISGGDTTSIWLVEPDNELTLENLTIKDGFSSPDFSSGLTNNFGKVNLIHCTFTENVTVDWAGGAIYNQGMLNITASTFYSNTVWWNAGGSVNNTTDGLVTITDSMFIDNKAYAGGGLYNSGVITITNSTIAGNSSDWNGGGLLNSGVAKVINSTISSNSIRQASGGGISNSGTTFIINTTITANSAPAGGGIGGESGITSINAIIADNPGGDCLTVINDAGHNLDSDGSCGLNPAIGSLPATDPLLGHLHNYGGPTLTHALLEGSPAIDAGDNAQCPAADQRGVPRPLDGDGDGLAVCDMGAYEFMVLPERIYLTFVVRAP